MTGPGERCHHALNVAPRHVRHPPLTDGRQDVRARLVRIDLGRDGLETPQLDPGRRLIAQEPLDQFGNSRRAGRVPGAAATGRRPPGWLPTSRAARSRASLRAYSEQRARVASRLRPPARYDKT